MASRPARHVAAASRNFCLMSGNLSMSRLCIRGSCLSMMDAARGGNVRVNSPQTTTDAASLPYFFHVSASLLVLPESAPARTSETERITQPALPSKGMPKISDAVGPVVWRKFLGPPSPMQKLYWGWQCTDSAADWMMSSNGTRLILVPST